MQTDGKRMETLSPSRLAWRRALEDPSLRDLHDKVETNEYGQLVMSPTKVIHGRRAGRIARLLNELITEAGEVTGEVGVDTPRGIKVPDVAWISASRLRMVPDDADALSVAPKICVEVLSRSSTGGEIDEKCRLNFACGADECWTCDAEGRMRFFEATGEVPSSKRVPGFPPAIH